jgi:hypothetical protein
MGWFSNVERLSRNPRRCLDDVAWQSGAAGHRRLAGLSQALIGHEGRGLVVPQYDK